VTADLRDFQERKIKLVKEIDDSKKSMEQLSRAYERARTEKDRYRFKAESLDQASKLVDNYTRCWSLPKRRRGPSSRIWRESGRPFRKGLSPSSPGSGESTVPARYPELLRQHGQPRPDEQDPELKQDVARFLKETEMLYKPQTDNSKEFDSLLKNLDKITEKFYSAYAQAALRKKILRQKKERLQIAIEMVRYSLALNTIQKGLDSINPEDFQKIPEVDSIWRA